MDRTINVDVTPEEHKALLAERERKAKEEAENLKKKKERNDEAVINHCHFKATIQALKTSCTVLIEELKEYEDHPPGKTHPFYHERSADLGETLERLLGFLLSGMVLVEEISSLGISGGSLYICTGGSRTMLAGLKIWGYGNLPSRGAKTMKEMEAILEGSKTVSKNEEGSDSDVAKPSTKKRKV